MVSTAGESIKLTGGGGSEVGCLLDMEARAALQIWIIGGLIPQARHGGIFVWLFAVAGSKFDGIGFEKEHIGQTQVAFAPSVGAAVTRRDGVS